MLKKRMFYLYIVLLVVALAAGTQAWWENEEDTITIEPLVAEINEPEERVEAEPQEPADVDVEPEEDSDATKQDEEVAKKEPTKEKDSASKEQPKKTVEKSDAGEERITLANRSSAEEPKQAPQEDKPPESEPVKKPQSPPAQRTLTYEDYTVQPNDTLWHISQNQGIPLPELLKVNKLTENSALSPGMTLSIPRHQIPRKETPGDEYGELLDWWTEAQYVFGTGKQARVIDFETGKSFMVRRSYGAFHADVEPLTTQDAQIMKEIWGGAWSWRTRPVIVEVDGRRLAASSNGMPHSIQTLTKNSFNGHFCIHFQNSTRHKDNLQQADHQQNVLKAAGKN